MRLVVPALLLAAATLASTAAAASGEVLSPLTPYKGKVANELAAEWWQWASSAPAGSNPVRDQDGSHCAVGQDGDVWFLAGGFGSAKIRRTCTVPAGKALFFPIVNMVYWPREGNTTYPCERAKHQAALNNDTALDLFAEIDGVPVDDPKRFRVATEKCFNLYGRIPVSERPYDAYPAATDGYWLLLAPLPKGRHTLKFGGRYNRESGAYGRMAQDIEYVLDVR